MYVAGVYNSSISTPIIVEFDVRAEEVRKLLTSFSTSSYVRVYGGMIDIIQDSTIIFRTTLKTPSNDSPDAYIDLKYLSETEISLGITYLQYWENNPNIIFICPWVQQNYYYIMGNIIKGELLAKQDNLREDPAFEELINMKSGNGMKFYKLAGLEKDKHFMIPIFSGFPNINKQDSVNIEVYQLNDISVLVNMIIFKKKFNRNIEMIYKILDIS